MSDSDNASEIPVCILSMFSRSSLLPHFFVLGVCVLVLNALQPKKNQNSWIFHNFGPLNSNSLIHSTDSFECFFSVQTEKKLPQKYA